ncbi:protein flightless-1 homolog [Paramacrobiotus metropolitanus]|uniref:protein flightless-1 homolog n=1 Tax=Paramacrobiotus metropolitanus TaxID=2943436 RepID=UPI0024465ABB|nr:protein flightless-1 homolog [Paramacrobiotus metropolitanus]
MASTGVLPFVRGIDFSRNDFQDLFPKAVEEMLGLRWLRLNRTTLEDMPVELMKLNKLEHLTLAHNKLDSLELHNPNGSTRILFKKMPSLRTLNARYNNIQTGQVPKDLFELEELSILDLSHNSLAKVPEDLDQVKTLIVLNLSNNSIESVPTQVFLNLTGLMQLDLSFNKLESLPPQLRRLINLQTLNLSNNPLVHFQFRQLPSLVNLQVLNLRNTHRNQSNLPPSLEMIPNLAELDLAENELTRVPECAYNVIQLRRLNLSKNQLSDFDIPEGWLKLQTLNVSHNKLKSLSQNLPKCTALKRLYVNNNELDFNGIPSSIGRLESLEVFMAADNRLEMVPEGLLRCGKLKKLILRNNVLVTLPDAIHLLTDLEELDLGGNRDLIMPPKPADLQKGAGLAFYNIDFSLGHQMRLAGSMTHQETPSPVPVKDPVARKIRLRRMKGDGDDESAGQVLKGMKDVARMRKGSQDDLDREPVVKSRKVTELEKPHLDYSDFFDDDTGTREGLTCWEIENFVPNLMENALIGKFYEADCYIILQTYAEQGDSLNWKIFYWIGEKAPLDKKACAAIHAVNLRNFLGAECRTSRQEQNEEEEEFSSLFPHGLVYIEGGRTASGFYTVEDAPLVKRLYRLHGTKSLHLETVPVSPASLDPRYVFYLDAVKKLYVWIGRKSKNVTRSKARLLAEKVNKVERKGTSEILVFNQRQEPNEFWLALGVPELPWMEEPKPHVPEDFMPTVAHLYTIHLGKGYLELPQVDLKDGRLKSEMLQSRNVYILDCWADLFVWFGKKSARLVRAAALKLSQELCDMLPRPDFAMVTRVLEGTESQIFKSKFEGWDDVMAVDFTRTAESVIRRGVDLKKILEKDQIKTDLTALFMPRQQAMPTEEAKAVIDEFNEDLDRMEAFVLEGKKFVRLPERETGHFYSGECYVFLCTYWVPAEESSGDEEKADGDAEETQVHTVYFWQGRDASNMGWLTFTFSLQKKFEQAFKNSLEVVRMHQQQENLKFLSHFKSKFIIHRGKRKEPIDRSRLPPPRLYQLRINDSLICARCIEIDAKPTSLNSSFCHMLNVPFDRSAANGIIYLWLGSKASQEDIELAHEIAKDMTKYHYTMQIVKEGEEPDNFFWNSLGGKKPYETSADFMKYSRLFRCSNEKGYFTVSEKCADFCQDDLADDDIMILDNGQEVFLWVGGKSSEVEIKLAFKSVQVYVQNLRNKQPERPRKLLLTAKGKETIKFSKCFHGWSTHKAPAM